MCNLHIETHFFIFSSFTFFTEKTTKNRCKAASGKKGRKTRPEDPPETRFGTQNGLKSTSEAPKSPKCSIKNRVGTSFASRTVQGSIRDRSRGGVTVLDQAGEIHPACKGESTMETLPHISYCLRCVRSYVVCRVPCVVVCCALCVVCFAPGGDHAKHRKEIAKTIGRSHLIFKN